MEPAKGMSIEIVGLIHMYGIEIVGLIHIYGIEIVV
jgi:hypothetical protein